MQPAIFRLIKEYAPAGMDARAISYATSFHFIAMGLADYHTKSESPVPHPSWMLYLDVPDVQASVDRAVKAGARVVIAPVQEDYNTWAVLIDPFGVPFGLSTYHDLGESHVMVRTESGEVVRLGEAARLG